jgi:SWI/SNF-related matrix-associated actin-dependent regulator of chromatin subfamily A-like protein 1
MSTKKIEKLLFFIDLLKKYKGVDNYILYLKNELKTNKNKLFKANQIDYVIKYHNFTPQLINKSFGITNYFGQQIKETYKLDFIPEKLKIYYYLGETSSSYNLLCKFRKNQDPIQLFVPKKQMLGDIFYQVDKINIDYNKYNELLSKHNRQILPHQPEAIEFLLSRPLALLADGMGMCKTCSTIIACLEKKFEKVLIICPSSLKINWYRELKLLSVDDNDIIIVKGDKWESSKKFTIINYDILDNFHEVIDGRKKTLLTEKLKESKLHNENFDLIIIDEAHNLSNSNSQRSKIINNLLKHSNIKHRWLLTGTPMTKRPINFYNLLNILNSPVTDDWVFYARRYCDGKQIMNKHLGRKIWLTSGSSNGEELRDKVKHLMLKRNIEEYIDMPEKIEIPNFYELSTMQKNKYDVLYSDFIDRKIEKDFESYCINNKIVNKEVGLSRFISDLRLLEDLIETSVIRKYLSMQMLPNTFDLIDSILEEDKKIIVFCSFTEELMEIHNHYKNISVIHYGEYDEKNKQKSIDRFQEDPTCKIFIGNIISSGVGINLTAGDYEIFNSMSWLPGINEQAVSRSWRNGRVGSVTVYYQLFQNTKSEEWFFDNINKKDFIDTVIVNDSKK